MLCNRKQLLSWEHVSLLTSFGVGVGGNSDAADQEEQGKSTSDAAADAGTCGYQKRRLSRGTAANSTDASWAKDL